MVTEDRLNVFLQVYMKKCFHYNRGHVGVAGFVFDKERFTSKMEALYSKLEIGMLTEGDLVIDPFEEYIEHEMHW